ncbi:Lrp/AsnC family transcriptional regulator [Nocardia sp. NPDC020380]|uniref:Lrp/AsnC family transcriptional regulator n=1 Tax=Nocardia sp. NPDC020380 TaxID=3364309 RepID=UPI0037B2CE29
MPEDTAKTPDTGGIGTLPPDSAAFSERDLDLVNALQINPRASWTRIGATLGLDATTVARRWQRLTDAGLAWMTAYAPEFATIGHVRVHCRAPDLAAVSAAVCATPSVFSVERIAGRHQLQLSVAAENLAALDDFTVVHLAALPGIEEVRVAISLHMYVEGSHWRPQALDAAQRIELLDDREQPAPSPAQRRAGDAALMLALSADGRRSAAELAQDTGLSETTVRRRLAEMTRSGRLIIRCDMAQQAAGWAVNMHYWVRIPADELDKLGAALAGWPEIRLCVATTDASNVLLIAWLRNQQESIHLETRLLHSFPALRIVERQMTLRVLKRMGRLLGPDGRAIGRVPFAVW